MTSILQREADRYATVAEGVAYINGVLRDLTPEETDQTAEHLYTLVTGDPHGYRNANRATRIYWQRIVSRTILHARHVITQPDDTKDQPQ
ncbi:hypothetical protein EP30_01160 [Bifidobacterium sp. UTCIF-39]|uniref:hypothetical protein n=1 Tax=Bifidobacterium sp. UTCIF-39 TaxID=1465359 RepID=UPI001125F2EF|nr:hypothetical protein [Bifidobacterium sp. UTCIF-39]TPF97580.1 hypothetical protein EP30_01160 [Bifidobacterium sp. UTCIF-39]